MVANRIKFGCAAMGYGAATGKVVLGDFALFSLWKPLQKRSCPKPDGQFTRADHADSSRMQVM